MRLGTLALALVLAAAPVISLAQGTGVKADEQIILKQIMADKKSVYAKGRCALPPTRVVPGNSA